MPCEDWRDARSEELARWYAAERERWLRVLGWDPAPVFALAEDARRAGRLAGLVARGERGRLAGVAYYNHERGSLQIGALHGDRADVVRDLLDRVLDSPEASMARRYQGFLFPVSSCVDAALTRRRFDVVPQLYLGCALDGLASEVLADTPIRPWRDEDVLAAARLLARAYAGSPTGAAFAPEGRLEEWVGYLGAVLQSPACGVFEPALTAVVESARPDRLAGLVLTTRVSASTVHLAQVAVDPDRHRRGLATAMVRHVSRQALPRGFADVTLLVSSGNEPAQRLYGRLGFERRASFLLASRGRITRQASSLRPADAAVIG